MATTTNHHEAQARTVKAMKLIAAVSGFAVKYGLDVEQVVRLASQSDRATFAQLAGVHIPSDETWALVVDSITGANAILAQVRS